MGNGWQRTVETCRTSAIATVASILLYIGAILGIPDAASYLKLPVTFYDFHSDGSNPEFGERANRLYFKVGHHPWDTLTRGTILSTLDADRKPVGSAGLDSTYAIEHVDKWFRPFVAGDTITFLKLGDSIFTLVDSICEPILQDTDTVATICQPVYDTTVPEFIITSDTCFKNVAIGDSLTLEERYGQYVYGVVSLAGAAYPLDGRGFLDDTTIAGHNACYSMEMHNRFVYHGGEQLLIGADDEFWVFINDSLRIDGGGMHWTIVEALTLDTLGLTAGEEYSIDIFWAERWGGGRLFVQTDLDFTEKRAYTVEDTVMDARPRHGGRVTGIGTNLRFALPETTQRIRLQAYTAAGQKILDQTYRAEEFSLERDIGKGVHFFLAHCLDDRGLLVGTLTGRMAGKP